MSRLDDELRRALMREEPSSGFTDRVMQQVAAAPAPRPRKSWWSELVSLFQAPRLRWVAIGIAVSLAIVVFGSQRWRSAPLIESTATTAVNKAKPEVGPSPAPESKPSQLEDKKPVQKNKKGPRRADPVRRQVARPETQVAQSDGEIAKERLMLALHIASASLNEAQKMVEADQ